MAQLLFTVYSCELSYRLWSYSCEWRRLSDHKRVSHTGNGKLLHLLQWCICSYVIIPYFWMLSVVIVNFCVCFLCCFLGETSPWLLYLCIVVSLGLLNSLESVNFHCSLCLIIHICAHCVKPCKHHWKFQASMLFKNVYNKNVYLLLFITAILMQGSH